MAKAVIYNQEGKQSGELELPKEMWEVPVNQALVQQAVVTQQANARVAIAHTKTRGNRKAPETRVPVRSAHRSGAVEASLSAPAATGISASQ